MSLAILQRVLLASVLLGAQLTGALCGVGHVREAVATVHAGTDAEAGTGAGAASPHVAGAPDGYCHGCQLLAASGMLPDLLPLAFTSPRWAGEAVPVPSRAPARERIAHRLARGPPAVS